MSCWMWAKESDGEWRCCTPGCMCRKPRPRQLQLFEFVEPIDQERVQAAVTEMKDKIDKLIGTRSQRLRDAGFTRRPSWRSLPEDE
jgi:hypothetical protein